MVAGGHDWWFPNTPRRGAVPLTPRDAGLLAGPKSHLARETRSRPLSIIIYDRPVFNTGQPGAAEKQLFQNLLSKARFPHFIPSIQNYELHAVVVISLKYL